ncbi:alpha/beta fold hydrolase [Streptomyces sp. NPDC054834]
MTTSVLHDRGGNGWSYPAELPRTAAEVTDELCELLHAGAVPGPYLLIGHSLGGAYARHYGRRFPDEVTGLLLLDPFHEDLATTLPDRYGRSPTRCCIRCRVNSRPSPRRSSSSSPVTR